LEYKTLKLNTYPSRAMVENTFPSSRVLGSAKMNIILDMMTPELKYSAEHIYLILTYLEYKSIS